MRDYTRQPVHTVKEVPAREVLSVIDYYLQDLSKGIARIQKGQVPDGSGDLIVNQQLSDIYLVLLGRPEDQVAHGGTLAGGSLTLASTRHSTKGKVYLGNAKTTLYDEVNDYIGIATATPAARLHIGVPAAIPSNLLAVADNTDGGWVNESGSNTNLYQSISDTSSTVTYIRWTIGAASLNAVFDCGTGFTNPGVTAGFVLHVTARWNSISDIRNAKINFHVANNSGGDIVKKSWGTSAASPDFAITNDGAFHSYTYTLTAGEVATIVWGTQPLRIQADFSGVTTGGGSIDIADFYLEIPAFGGGGGSVTLQEWEIVAGSANTLSYAANIASQTVLRISGNPAVSFASGVEFASGTPASGMIWTSKNTDGLGQWASASSIATKVQHRFVANGPYRIDNDVDGAYIAPHAITMVTALLYRRAAGAAGTTSVNLLKNGVTMFSANATVGATGGASATGAGTFSVTTVAAGDRLTVSAAAVETGRPSDWVLLIEGY